MPSMTLSQAASLLSKSKKGHKKRMTEKQRAANRLNLLIAHAIKRGDSAEADRLRWEQNPERMRMLALRKPQAS